MKKIFFPVLFSFIFFSVINSCKQAGKQVRFGSNDISNVITRMTDLMVHDITNPPLASRFFSYACLAGYEIVSENNSKYPGMHGVLNEYPEIKRPDSITGYSYQLSALLAMIGTARKMQPSGRELSKYEDQLIDSCIKAGMDEEQVEKSKRYALYISGKILDYARADRYNKISARTRYIPINKPGCWYPTPPGYFDAVEPYFSTIRPFVLDSASEYLSPPPTVFDSVKGSPFYKLAEAVYKEGNNLTLENRAIASFWDCNPFAIQDEGHLQYGFKKISPGAHWLGITGIVCANANKDFDESMKIFTSVSVGLMDAFMTCWDEKYRSNRIRPETAIRKYIDPDWQPLLQTPPFPEYLSGHSVISSSSATILTHYFGDNVHFTDSVEVSYGLPPRNFVSFLQAANEAAISRFYGGIHYQDAIQNGLVQGAEVGRKVIEKIK